jgi:hypothetical protein
MRATQVTPATPTRARSNADETVSKDALIDGARDESTPTAAERARPSSRKFCGAASMAHP